MAIGDIARVTVGYLNTNDGKRYSNTFHYADLGLTPPTMQDIGDAIFSWWDFQAGTSVPIRTMVATFVSLDRVERQYVDPFSPTINVYTDNLPDAGAGTGEPMAPQNAYVITLRTALGGRSRRGRVFLPPFGEGKVQGGSMSAADAAGIAEQTDSLSASFTAATADLIVYSKLLGNGASITEIRVDQRGRVQRRRQLRNPVYAG